jgi:eukaryotic-like serine/threonine-protein kinase
MPRLPYIFFLCILLTACGPAPAATSAPAIETVMPTMEMAVTNTPEVSTTPESKSTLIREKDDMEMVYIPAGKFTMGSGMGDSDEVPVHTVYLDAYYIDKFEVSNAQYRACVESGACDRPIGNSYTCSSYYGNSQYDNYPVIYVNWNQAKAYCDWAGAALPTEAQWEKAAQGTDGPYPWGEGIDCTKANYRACNMGDTTAVGSYPDGASPYGALDMAGNVMEFVNDWYSYNYYSQSPDNNPTGPASGDGRVVRGGAWYDDTNIMRTSTRSHGDPNGRIYGLGFRCARNAASPLEKLPNTLRLFQLKKTTHYDPYSVLVVRPIPSEKPFTAFPSTANLTGRIPSTRWHCCPGR